MTKGAKKRFSVWRVLAGTVLLFAMVAAVAIYWAQPKLAFNPAPKLIADPGLYDMKFEKVLVETNGTLDIGGLPPGSVAIVDVKCPGSGAGDSFNLVNLDRFRRHDEVKFVLSDRGDFEWAAGFVKRHGLAGRCAAILFSPVAGRLDPKALAGWLVESKLPVRLQIQLPKTLGVA